MSDARPSTAESSAACQVDLAALNTFLATQPDIVAAYLFGSLAEGRAHPRSDVDVAILLAGVPDTLTAGNRQLQLLGDLQPFAAPRALDVVILNMASPLLAHQVLRQGRLIYEGDRETRVEFEVRTGQTYADLIPMYEFHNRDLLRKIKEVGLRTQTSSFSTACGY
jgi:predicted nucleotidyltransferase